VSPAFLPPATDAPLYTAIGTEEIEGFHIQNRLIAERWCSVRRVNLTCPGKNHFTVLDELWRSAQPRFHVAAGAGGAVAALRRGKRAWT